MASSLTAPEAAGRLKWHGTTLRAKPHSNIKLQLVCVVNLSALTGPRDISENYQLGRAPKEKIAGEPVSRILFASKLALRCVTIIPLGSGSLRNSSSLPEGRRLASHATRNFRAGPALPSYLALLHAGFAVPRMLPFGRWALAPPFPPYQVRSTVTGGPSVSRRPAAEVRSSPAVCFSVALSVAAPSLRTFARLDAQPPGVTRRVALHCVVSRPRSFVPRSCEPERFGVRTFLPPLPFRKAAGDHPAHPLRGLYAKSH